MRCAVEYYTYLLSERDRCQDWATRYSPDATMVALRVVVCLAALAASAAATDVQQCPGNNFYISPLVGTRPAFVSIGSSQKTLYLYYHSVL